MIAPIFQHHRSDSPRWSALIDAANLEHDGDWPVVQVSLASGAELVDWQERITEEVIYANDRGNGTWSLDYQVDHPYGGDDWAVSANLYEPANFVTPGLLDGLFGGDLEQGATVRFQCVLTDSYDCEDCRDGEQPEGGCDHLIGWSLVWAIQDVQ
jgi:hypothetical protein